MPPAEVETCTLVRARNGPVFLFYIPYSADSAIASLLYSAIYVVSIVMLRVFRSSHLIQKRC